MEVLKLMFFCVIMLLPMALLKKYSGEQAVLLTIAVLVMVVFRLVTYLTPFFETTEELLARAGVSSSYITILFKTVAASVVSHLCADLCRDGGSQTLATLIEMTGTIAIVLIAMPILQAVIDLLLGYFN